MWYMRQNAYVNIIAGSLASQQHLEQDFIMHVTRYVMHVTRYVLCTIHSSISQSCKLIEQPVDLVLLLLHFGLDILQLVLNTPQLLLNCLQQESCEQENLTSQLPPITCFYFYQISLPVFSSRNLLRIWMVAFCQVLSSLSTAAICVTTVKITLADTLLLCCVAWKRLGQ